MTLKANDADDPKRWLAFAKSDLKLARKGRLPDIRLESLCYLSQQAAEKALKALLIHCGIHFPKTHKIEDLIALLPGDIAPPSSVKTAVDLSDYAVDGRYPQNLEDVTKKEYGLALKKAEMVVDWVEKQIEKPEPDDLFPGIHETPASYAAHPKSKGEAQVGKPRRKKRKRA